MEFFEKAHVVKRNQNIDDNMKKQLKQMLYGYKQNDNKLIRDAANIEKEDDSTSVSGFSDLDLTVSSSEGNSTRQRISFIGPGSVKDAAISLDDSIDSQSHKSSSSFDENDFQKISDVSLSDINEDIESLSEGSVSINESNDSDDDFSMTSTSVGSASDVESSASEPFDPDGTLASKIFEKLKLRDNPKVTKKERKRKLDQIPAPKNYSQDSQMESDSSVEVLSEKGSGKDSVDTVDYSNITSPSFVSVNAVDMPHQSLSDVLGDYTYPTVRNLPSEAQNLFATNKSGIFPTLDEESVNDVNDSLLPELGSVLDDPEVMDLDSSTDMPVEESSLAYDETIDTEETFQRENSTESVDTNFVNPVNIFYGKNCCILILKHPAEIYIHGKVKVTLLGGLVEIGGYTLQDKTYKVYAPNYNCAQYLRTLDHDKGYYGLFAKLTGSGLSVAATEEIVTTLSPSDSIVQLQPLHDRIAQFVENSCTITDLFSKTNKNVDGCFRKASDFLGCSLYLMKPWKSFEENPCWSQALQHGYKPQSKGILCGGKGSGKSSFLRYYVNKLLARGAVLVIDLDPGQSEFTPAGSVSATVVEEPLLGPPFTHLKTPERMLNIGIISTMDNPRRYATAVQQLIDYCHSEPRFQDLPWIVNTMGMVNALGLQFMALMTILLQPTFILQIDSKNPKKRYAHHLDSDTVKSLYYKYQYNYLFKPIKLQNEMDYALIISNADSVKGNFSLPPKEERYLNFLAYFGSLMTNNATDDFLLSVVPYEVDLRNLYIALNVRINEENIARVINGKIVALCKHEGDGGKIYTLRDTPLRCYGHGLVRGIDSERGLCYVVTPAAAVRTAADTLLYADWAPELRAGASLPAGSALPYRAPAAAPQRQLMSAPRRRYNPLQLIKMSRGPKVKASIG
ncbi:polynucleotide 5'-hydroxyl-kinase NOL9 [Leguminivora glycinivorella]|uniref:polynucleotide 5'-hydroxyl-kinase NOL9 n=1 Tax=Leguminivora glycinivorella TaxID=1035111 RepID=UPI00200D0914|nr:polynucleotide 5'-hydroxyl-kinase NOL9 [Leguminivora glycinivorella]XP_047996530.1 polynucleotide 5'-hydroxyl-kinase NOL9 [Leguminivora glycinivorella]XP_047996531.1 polynucleotide 5'-hydroxyl-kinase NOL9 [Leguminivora glycinivorella]